MLILQTVYPSGLNNRLGDECMEEKDSGAVGIKFVPLHRLYKCPEVTLCKQRHTMIKISKIINDKSVKKNLPAQFNKTEQILTVFTLTKTMQSKIFNHKELDIRN